ncbi:TPA: DMT family transporter [Salmonella enterica]|nr:DMT family transporter [Salmonella enterica]
MADGYGRLSGHCRGLSAGDPRQSHLTADFPDCPHLETDILRGRAFYVTWPVLLIRSYGAIPVVGWSLFIGGMLLFILSPETRGTRAWGLSAILSAGYLIVVGTAVTFCLYLSGARKIGSVRASAICCIEPLVSAVLSVLLLHIAFGPADWTGTLMVLLAVMMIR